MGYRYRLSSEVLRYPLPGVSPSAKQQQQQQQQLTKLPPSTNYLRCLDQVLPSTMLEHMQHVFGPDSRFWREHNYDPGKKWSSF
jgi:hypothetical protein